TFIVACTASIEDFPSFSRSYPYSSACVSASVYSCSFLGVIKLFSIVPAPPWITITYLVALSCACGCWHEHKKIPPTIIRHSVFKILFIFIDLKIYKIHFSCNGRPPEVTKTHCVARLKSAHIKLIAFYLSRYLRYEDGFPIMVPGYRFIGF